VFAQINKSGRVDPLWAVSGPEQLTAPLAVQENGLSFQIAGYLGLASVAGIPGISNEATY